MTTPFGGPARTAPGPPNLPTPPTGWPVGSYATYEEAQRAVDHLADSDFPVRDVTIVGVDLMLVEGAEEQLRLGQFRSRCGHQKSSNCLYRRFGLTGAASAKHFMTASATAFASSGGTAFPT